MYARSRAVIMRRSRGTKATDHLHVEGAEPAEDAPLKADAFTCRGRSKDAPLKADGFTTKLKRFPRTTTSEPIAIVRRRNATAPKMVHIAKATDRYPT